MRKAYLFVYSDLVGTREQVRDILDTMPEVITWRYDLPNCFYIISEAAAETISEQFRAKRGDVGRWIFSEVTDNKQGFLLKETWFLLNNKSHFPTPKS